MAVLLLGGEGGADGPGVITEGEYLVAHRFLLAFHQLNSKFFSQEVLPHCDRKRLPFVKHRRMVGRQGRVLTNIWQLRLEFILVADLIHFEGVFL